MMEEGKVLRIHEIMLFLKRRYSAMSISLFSLDEYQAIESLVMTRGQATYRVQTLLKQRQYLRVHVP
jgi:hypothetical protein